MLRVDRRQSDNLNPSQEDPPISSQSHYPKSQINYSDLALHTKGRNAVLSKESSDSGFSTGAVKVPPRRHHARNKLTRGYSPVQVKAAVGFGQNDREAFIYAHSFTGSPHTQGLKSEMHISPSRPKVHPQRLSLSARPKAIGSLPAYFIPNRFNPHGSDHKPSEHKMDTLSPGSVSAEKVDAHMSGQTWSPRGYSSDVASEARGYAHVRHLKPGFDKTRHDSALAVPAGKQPGGWHPLQQDRAQTPVQGKFKPFQRVSDDDLPVHNHSDNESASTQASTETTVPPGLGSTVNTMSGVPLFNEELSTTSVSTMQTEGHDEELVPQVTNSESRSESSAGPSLEEKDPLTVSTSTPQPTEKERWLRSQVLYRRIRSDAVSEAVNINGNASMKVHLWGQRHFYQLICI